MNHGSLFSGIGGFDLAAEWAGWNNKFHCEWNEFGRKVLNYYWPESKSYGDITQSDFTIWRGKIDILTGGFPCQPYSQAGKRLGKEDERHLWPEMLRAIREIRPSWVVGENVYGLVNWSGGLVFEEVQTDMEAEGYEVQPVIIPACGVGAPHKRERIWFIAHNSSKSGESKINKRGKHIKERAEVWNNNSTNGREQSIADSKSKRGGGLSKRKVENNSVTRINGKNETITNTSRERLEGGIRTQKSIRFKQRNKENASDSIGSGRVQNNIKQPSKQFKQTCSSWEGFPTQSPICSRNDGLSNRLDGITFPKWRAESIKAYGNAIVPQVAYEIFKVINQMELNFP